MSWSHNLTIILVMALVSYLPRVLPATFMGKIRLNPYLNRVLNLIPYTAMTALVFPSILDCVPSSPTAAAAGTVAAILSAALRAPLSLTVVVAVAVVWGVLQFPPVG
ncbi:MAG: AzlD domain-containing protein [Succinivibrionaceae bacterium]|nr:AzlD domain-containing protein [Succinivibrionaceae bacterium]